MHSYLRRSSFYLLMNESNDRCDPRGGVFHVQLAFPVKSASDPVVVGARSDEISSGAELLERWEYGDPVEPARYYVHREVNARLRGHVSPAVLPYRKGDIYFFPDCLRSALYTLFMLELSGRQRPAILCARLGCGRCFEPAHSRQQYCETRCQQLAYYYRRKASMQAN